MAVDQLNSSANGGGPVPAPWLSPAAKAQLVDILQGQLRHGLTALAGVIATWGVTLSPNQSEQLVAILSSVIVYGIGAAWSWWQKTGREQFIARVAELHFAAEQKKQKETEKAAMHEQATTIVQAVANVTKQ